MSHGPRLALLLAGLTVAMLGGFFLLFTTEAGLRILWAGLGSALPEGLEVKAVSGRVLGPLRVQGIRYGSGTLLVRIESLDLDWRPAALLRGYLDLERVDAGGVEITRLAEGEEPISLPARIHLPVAVYAGRVSIGPLRYRADPAAAPVVVDRITAALNYSSGVLTVSELRVRAPDGSGAGNARLETSGAYPVSGTFTLKTAMGDMAPAEVRLGLSGDLGRLRADVEVRRPYRITATAVVDDPLNDLRYDLHADARRTLLSEIEPDWPVLTITASVYARGDLEHSDLGGWSRTTVEGLGPIRARLEAARVEAGQLRVGALALELDEAPGRLSFTGELGLSGPETRVQGRIHWRDLQWPVGGVPQISSRQGEARIHGSLDRPVARVDFALGAQGRVQGDVRGVAGGRLEMEASWQDLRWPEQVPRVESPEGRLRLEGDLDGYELAARAGIRQGAQWNGSLNLKGRGDRNGLRLRTLALRTAAGGLRGRGAVTWHPQLRLEAELAGKRLDPRVVLPEWPGKVGLGLNARATRRGGHWEGVVERFRLSGELRGYPIEATGSGRLQPDGVMKAEFDLNSGRSTVTLKGSMDAREVGLDWQVDSPELAALWPGGGGSLHGKGWIRGPRHTPRIVTRLSGTGVRLGEYRVDRLDLDADVDLSDRRRSDIRLRADGAGDASVRLEHVSLDARGKMARHQLSAQARSGGGMLKLDLHGALSEREWRFRLVEASMRYAELRPWILQGAARGRVARGGQSLELSRNCWRSGSAHLCLEGSRGEAGERARFSLTDLPLEYLSPWLSPNTDLKGALSATGHIERPPAGPLALQVRLRTTAGHLLPVSLHDHPEDALRFSPGSGQLRVGAQGVVVNFRLPLAGVGEIGLDLKAPGGREPLEDWPLKGGLAVEIGDLRFVQALVPEIRDVAGDVAGRIDVGGTVGHPVLAGRLGLRRATFSLSTPGIRLEKVSLELEGRGQDGVHLKGRATSGGGDLAVDGEIRLGAGGVQVRLTVTGSKFQVADLSEAQVFASPDLKIALKGEEVRVRGEIRIPEARIRLRELPSTAVTVSKDEVIVGEAAEDKTPGGRYRVDAQARLILGKRVSFQGFGLKADLRGTLTLKEQHGKRTTATGDIEVLNGRYQAYGQDLDIKEGRLLFAGGLVSNPGLYIRAVRRGLTDVVVGVKVTGTLSRPKVDLFSDPDMSQQSQLSYLLLGRAPEAETSDEEQKSIDQAALALGLGAGGSLLGDLGEGLGLDEVGVEGKGEDGARRTALVVGKYLSPKLYVSYGMGVFEPISTIRLRYTLTSRWKLVTESSAAGSGMDIYYVIDR